MRFTWFSCIRCGRYFTKWPDILYCPDCTRELRS